MQSSIIQALATMSFDFPPVTQGYTYPQDRGRRSGVRAAKRQAQKRRNVRARSKK